MTTATALLLAYAGAVQGAAMLAIGRLLWAGRPDEIRAPFVLLAVVALVFAPFAAAAVAFLDAWPAVADPADSPVPF